MKASTYTVDWDNDDKARSSSCCHKNFSSPIMQYCDIGRRRTTPPTGPDPCTLYTSGNLFPRRAKPIPERAACQQLLTSVHLYNDHGDFTTSPPPSVSCEALTPDVPRADNFSNLHVCCLSYRRHQLAKASSSVGTRQPFSSIFSPKPLELPHTRS